MNNIVKKNEKEKKNPFSTQEKTKYVVRMKITSNFAFFIWFFVLSYVLLLWLVVLSETDEKKKLRKKICRILWFFVILHLAHIRIRIIIKHLQNFYIVLYLLLLFFSHLRCVVIPSDYWYTYTDFLTVSSWIEGRMSEKCSIK